MRHNKSSKIARRALWEVVCQNSLVFFPLPCGTYGEWSAILYTPLVRSQNAEKSMGNSKMPRKQSNRQIIAPPPPSITPPHPTPPQHCTEMPPSATSL